MNIYFFYIVFFLASTVLIFISKKYRIFQDNKIELHKRKLNKSKTLYLGGLFFLIFLSYELTTIEDLNSYGFIFFMSIFV